MNQDASRGGEERPQDALALSIGERIAAAAAAILLRAFFRLLIATCHIDIAMGAERFPKIASSGSRVIFSIWHSQLFLSVCLFRHRRVPSKSYPIAMLTSWSRDGEIGARLMRGWGASPVRGSSTRGGSAAVRKLCAAIREGHAATIILPDGPKGPERKAKRGTAVLAKLTGLPILPIGVSINRAWRIKSWDRMLVPKPFSRIVVACGEPIHVPPGVSREELDATTISLQTALDELTASAEARVRKRS